MWNKIKLNDERYLPEIGFGSWQSGSGQSVLNQIQQAFNLGFIHFDTAQIYNNEKEVGQVLSKLNRNNYWLTTKWSAKNGKGIQQSIQDSLSNLNLTYVDLYLIHSPRLTSNISASWIEFEQLKKEGKAKSIGVSNFNIENLEEIRLAGLSTPAVNQILLHPYVLQKTLPLLLYHAQHNIVTEAYSVLIPITKRGGGPIDPYIDKIAQHYQVENAEILFAWARSKDAVILTASRQESRLRSFLHAGSLELTALEIQSIDRVALRQELADDSYTHIPGGSASQWVVGVMILMTLAWLVRARLIKRKENITLA